MVKERTAYYEVTPCGDIVPPFNNELPPAVDDRREIDPDVEEAILKVEMLRDELQSYGANEAEVRRKIARRIAHLSARLVREHDVSGLLALLSSKPAGEDAWTPSSNHPEPTEPRHPDWMERAAGDY